LCPELARFDCFGRTVVVMAYGGAMSLAVLIVFLLGWVVAVRRGLPPWRSSIIAMAAAASFPAGARLLQWLLSRRSGSNDTASLFRPEFSGFALPGGMLLAVAVGLVLCRLLKVNWWRIADSLSPALCLGSVAMRAGCFLNGCCFGRETSQPWGVVFPMGSPAHLYQAAGRFESLFSEPLPVHPTQLYELAAGLAALAACVALLRRNAPDGVPAMAALCVFVAMRWAVHHLRAVPMPPGLGGDVSYGAALLLAGAMLVLRRRTPRRMPVVAAQAVE
jgi:phosphatidylglycerol---prolipoprotein diacylglyceryl transferase